MEYTTAGDGPIARELETVALRDADEADLDVVARLLEQVYGEFEAHFPADLWPFYLGEIVNVRSRLGASELIVAELDGRLVGTVGFYPDGSRSGLESWPAGWASIRALAVLAHARGSGVGRALVGECLRRARACGATAVGLHTNPFMASANRLYEQFGFRRAPGFDIEIGEMFTGRALSAGAGWQAQAFQLDL